MATYKNRLGISVRRSLIKKIASSIKSAKEKKKFNLILLHGAGAAGHQLARKYGLKDGTAKNGNKWRGALLSRVVNQKLNTAITEIFVSKGLRVVPVHTASIVLQKNKKIIRFDTALVKEALRQKCFPLLYGDMVFDTALGMSICSGDALVPYLAKKLNAPKIFFASDINGIYTKDPYINKNAKLIKEITLQGITRDVQLSKSHNVDVTGGLLGKMEELQTLRGASLKTVEIFNGLREKNYKKILLGEKFPHTVIQI